MPFLPPNQQRQSTEGHALYIQRFIETRAYGPGPPPCTSLCARSVDIGYCLGLYPSRHPPLSCCWGQIILSPQDPGCRDTMRDLTFVPPTPATAPENSYRGYNSLVCVRVDMSVRSPHWWFLGGVSGERANAQHTLSINAVVILLVQDVTVQVLSDVWSQCIPHMRIGSRETSVSPTWHIQQYILNGIHLVHYSQISHVNFYLKLPVFSIQWSKTT